jgi:hypothetical protein
MEDDKLAESTLSKSCLGYSNSEEYDKGLIRILDLIANYKSLEKKLLLPD